MVPYSPLGKGFLTSKINEDSKLGSDNFRSRLPRFTPETTKANEGFVDLLASIAKENSATPAQIALAWLLVQKPWIVPIPGTTKLSRLEENIGAVGIELTEAELRTIDEASWKIKDISSQPQTKEPYACKPERISATSKYHPFQKERGTKQ